MQQLADYILVINGDQFPVSPPETGDQSQSFSSTGEVDARPLVTLGLSAEGGRRIHRFVGREGRLLTNIYNPGVDLGRLRILKVDGVASLLVGEVVRPRESDAAAAAVAPGPPPTPAEVERPALLAREALDGPSRKDSGQVGDSPAPSTGGLDGLGLSDERWRRDRRWQERATTNGPSPGSSAGGAGAALAVEDSSK